MCRINGVVDRVVIVLIIKPPRPGRRGSLELGRRASNSKLVSKLFGVVDRDDPGELDNGVLKRSIGKWLCSQRKMRGLECNAHVAPHEEGFVHCGPQDASSARGDKISDLQ